MHTGWLAEAEEAAEHGHTGVRLTNQCAARPIDRKDIGSWALREAANPHASTWSSSHGQRVMCRLVVIDTKDTWAHELVEAGTVDKLIQADLSDHEHVFNICMDAISKVEQVRATQPPTMSMIK